MDDCLPAGEGSYACSTEMDGGIGRGLQKHLSTQEEANYTRSVVRGVLKGLPYH